MAVSQEHSNYLVYARFSVGAISFKSADKDNNLGAVFTAPLRFFLNKRLFVLANSIVRAFGRAFVLCCRIMLRGKQNGVL